MDASDEFKFVVVSGRTRNNGHHKEGCRDPLPRSGSVENLRSVPVRIYNTSKNLKLEFLWNRAFKLFQHRTVKVYQAVSGINYQESYGERSCSHSGTSRSTGISLRAKSLSHSHLSISGLENIMEQPGTSRGNCSSGGGKGGSNRKILVEGSSSGNNDDDDNKIKTAYEQHQPVAMPRKRTVSKLASISSSSGSRNNATTTVNANPTTSSNKQQRPVSISGGEKPQGDEGRMDDNCISMGNNIRIPPPFLPAHLRRSQSARSRCSVDSLLSCHNHNDNGEISSTHVLSSNSSQFHSRVHKKLAKSNTQPTPVAAAASPIYNNSWSISSSPCPDFGSTGAFERGNCSDDCSSEIVSNLDSGLDTWKATTRSPSPCSSGMKPKLRDSSGIVCTISQRIPTSDAKSEGALQPEATSQISTRYDDSLENCRKMMNYNNNCSGTGNTTVVLINGCFESDLCQNVAQYDSLNLSDYDYECMSEVDLNSEPGSTGSGVVAAAFVGGVSSGVVCDKEKLTRVCNLSCENNELDSLDLTLFEEARRAGPVASFCATIMTDTTFRQDNDEPLYDTVCSEEHGDSLSGVRNYTPNESGGSNNINSWSDAGSEFEFMSTNAASNREIVMGHVPRGNPPEVDWEPYYCVLNQLDQIFTGYRSEDFYKLTDNGISSTEVPRMRLDGGPNSIKCLIGNAAKWGMNTLLEEEEESGMLNGSTNDKSKNADSSSGSIHRNSSPPLDTSYDKACSSTERERRSSAPLTPLLGGRETSSRFANFFSKRSFKSNPLKRTKSVTKLERKKSGGGLDNDSGLLYPSRLRTSRSHESLLAWTNHSVSNLVNNGMMSTIELAGGNVTIRPLHPSVLGQDFAFQISAPVGSKYYLCSSAAERDAWVFALRQAIKPHADEIRRQDNGLKIWVLEAKGIVGTGKSSSKKYFCELYLDDTLFARTCAKTKGDMLFWGEHFEFSQLPNCVQMITVVLFREGDKKKKKERNTCLGRVKIPVNSVNSRYLIEKWYPVVPDSSSSKDKEVPSMRVKCKYQSVDILPVRCYKSFLQYIKNEYGPVSEALESVLSVKAKEDLANALVHVLHHEGLAKEFIAELALQEILKSGDEKLTFRGNSIATKAMEAFLKLSGTEYLHSSLGPFVSHFQRSEDVCDCEVDPMKLSPGADLLKNQRNLRMAVDTVWKSILHSHSMFPVELRECFSHCREALRTAGKDEISDHLISASLYLRFLCPAVLSPSLFNITNEYPTEKSARNLTLVAKVLQTLANFTKFQGKESYMEFINEFLEKEASSMKAFLSCISSPLTADMAKKPKVPPGGFIDLGKYSSILSTLLAENVAKIAPKNDRFKPLQEILETIHLWLKQPANATNIASFPFPPHVTTPAPTIPPPPAPLGVPMSYRGNNNNTPSSLHSQGGSNNSSNHQYQVPVGPSPIYAVSSVLHNNANPNVKNISQMNNRNWVDNNNGHQLALQLQIPQAAQPQTAVLSNNHRSGSQASSGYQSQSPVLEGDDKTKKAAVNANINTQIGHPQSNNRDETGNTTALTFTNPTFHRKVGSHSVDNLSSLGVDFLNQSIVKRRLARSSSSSDCEPEQMPMPMKPKLRSGVASDVLYGNLQPSSSSSHSKQPIKSNHNRLHRRSSAELLRKNHPYSSSTDDEEYDAPINQQRQEITPQLPPRRGQLKRNSALRPTPIVDGSFNETLQEDMRKSFQEGVPGINCSEYEREMVDLRRAMEVLQVKLSRAEERLFGSEGNGQSQQPQQQQQQQQRDGDRFFSSSFVQSPGVNNVRMEEDKSRDMDHLLQRLLSAEEEMRREQELLVALDKKQQLIDAQEEKIARLDSVNNQLLDALAQIRDTLQQQHVQQQQQKIQQQLVYHQQHLQNLSNSMIPAANGYPRNSTNRKNSSYDRTNFNPHGRQTTTRDSESHSMYRSNSINNINNNTTKVLITNGNNNDSSMQQTPHQSNNCDIDNRNDSNRNSATYLGEQALQMLAELKSSSC